MQGTRESYKGHWPASAWRTAIAWSQIYWWKILNVASWSWIYIHSWKPQAAATPWGIEHENVNACSYLLMSSVVLLLHIVDKFAFASGCNDHSFLSHNTMTVLAAAAAAAAETKSPNFAVPFSYMHSTHSLNILWCIQTHGWYLEIFSYWEWTEMIFKSTIVYIYNLINNINSSVDLLPNKSIRGSVWSYCQLHIV